MPARFSFVRERRMIARSLLVLATVGLGYLYGYAPRAQRMNYLDQEIRDARTRLKNNLKAVSRLKPIENEYQRVYPFLKGRKMNDEVLSGMLSGVEECALKNKVEVKEMAPQVVSDGKTFRRFSLSTGVEGSMAGIVRFIHALQGSAFGYSVQEAYFSGSPRQSNDVLCRIVLSSLGAFDFAGDDLRFSQVMSPGFLGREIFSAHQERNDQPGIVSDEAIAGDLEFIKNNFRLRGIIIDENSVAAIEDIKQQQTVFLSKREKIKGAVLKDISEDGIVFEQGGSILKIAPIWVNSKKGYQ